MNKLLEFTNKYSLSKTLRFKLEPVGRTSEYIKRAQIIEEDESRATYVIKMKEIMDDYHKNFIDNVLSRFSFSNSLLSELYNELSSGDSNNRSQNIAKILGNLRKEVAKAFSNAKANELKKKEFINATPKRAKLSRNLKASPHTSFLTTQIGKTCMLPTINQHQLPIVLLIKT